MKFNIKTLCILLATAAMAFTSCDDFLDRQEDEKMTFDKIWESRYTTQQYWLTTMSFLPNLNGSFVGDSDPYLGASDEATVAYDRAYRYMNFGSWNASLIPYYKMDTYYREFHLCFAESLKSYSSAGLHDLFNHVMEKVEGLYTHWFLGQLGNNWSDACSDELREYGRILEVPQQEEFYSKKIKDADTKMFSVSNTTFNIFIGISEHYLNLIVLFLLFSLNLCQRV